MRAIRVYEHGGPEVMRLEEVPDLQPAAGQVVVRVRAAGINPVETYIRAGRQGYTADLPYTPGGDAAGEVLAVGEGVEGCTPGDRVYCAGTLSGAYAEQALCRADQVFALPERLRFAQGAALGPYATAYQSLFHRAHARPGETVLVHGASGGVGIAGVQLARAAGMIVIGTAGTEAGRQLVREQGADHALDHHDDDHFEQALALTNGRGLDVILEMLANVNLGRDLPILARGGRVVVIGSRGEVTITPRDLMRQDGAVLGMMLGNATPADLRSLRAALHAGLASGSLNPVIDRELPLAEAAEAHRAVIEDAHAGKMVLVP